MSDQDEPAHAASIRLTTLGALGVVYGDLGTSPLYALKEAARAASEGSTLSPDAVLGSVSLIFWALILIIAGKYSVLILRADNRGEGGIVAMLALLQAREAEPRTWRAALLVIGLIGAALLYGDGAITPAISVLSAVEGLKVDAPFLAPLVVPISVVILVGLFAVQRKGTGFIGHIFGPVMLAWFVAIGVLGIVGILQAPRVLAAANPLYAWSYLSHAPLHIGFGMLGATFLALTGGEAMYADMGHFGRNPIRIAWFAVVMPGLLLNYFGQAALLISDPTAIDNPFFQLAPDWAHYPLVAFATLAAVIASQAIISGVFSLTQQAMQLGFFPAVHVAHTASDQMGQIYVPIVNWMLAAATLAAVFMFKTSDALAGAYGIAVSLLMAITTILAALIALKWGYNPFLVVAVNGFFFVIDLIFFSANATKLADGGWFPLVLAALLALIMLTWRGGQRLVNSARGRLRQSESEFLEMIAASPPIQLPGTAAFLASSVRGLPLALTSFYRHNHALHERILLITAHAEEIPRVDEERRVKVIPVTPAITRVVLRFGFMEEAEIPEALRCGIERELLPPLDLDSIYYYIGRETVIPRGDIPGMAIWRESLFAFMQRNAERSAAYFQVPARQVIEVGTEIEI